MNYLRISLTERCNLRCNYCAPEGSNNKSRIRGPALTLPELARLTAIFSDLGIKYIRLTGGEPLLRKGTTELVRTIRRIKNIKNIYLTTNGVLLKKYISAFKKTELSGINISLDTLKREKFKKITAHDGLRQVIAGIEQAKKDLRHSVIKVNSVIVRETNQDEIIDFVNFALDKKIILRFIEFMPLSPLWRKELFVPAEEIKRICAAKFPLKKTRYKSCGPAEYYKVGRGIIGFIKTRGENCPTCHRLRITSQGILKLCIYQTQGLNLKGLLKTPGIKDKEIKQSIKNFIEAKKHTTYAQWNGRDKTYMYKLGG